MVPEARRNLSVVVIRMARLMTVVTGWWIEQASFQRVQAEPNQREREKKKIIGRGLLRFCRPGLARRFSVSSQKKKPTQSRRTRRRGRPWFTSTHWWCMMICWCADPQTQTRLIKQELLAGMDRRHGVKRRHKRVIGSRWCVDPVGVVHETWPMHTQSS